LQAPSATALAALGDERMCWWLRVHASQSPTPVCATTRARAAPFADYMQCRRTIIAAVVVWLCGFVGLHLWTLGMRAHRLGAVMHTQWIGCCVIHCRLEGGRQGPVVALRTAQQYLCMLVRVAGAWVDAVRRLARAEYRARSVCPGQAPTPRQHNACMWLGIG
jgi:hypothetical protein